MTTDAVTDLGWSTALLGAVASCTSLVLWAIPGCLPASFVVFLIAAALVGTATCCWIVTWRRDRGRHRRR